MNISGKVATKEGNKVFILQKTSEQEQVENSHG